MTKKMNVCHRLKNTGINNAVFHALRAVNILNGYDSSKHSGVIAYFNKNFLKENKLDRSLYKIIKDSSYLRE